MPSIVVLNGVSFETPNGRTLFSNLNLSLEPKITALVGPNGIGKTCLARLIAGQLQPSRGDIRRGQPVGFLPQRYDPPDISVSDFLSSDYAWPALGEELLNGIDRDALCSRLSGGQWMKVRLARTFDDGFLILDEPTNDLDREGREAVQRFIQEHAGGLLLISHDRECLALCDEFLELSNQGLSRFGGGWLDYQDAKRAERSALHEALEDAKRSREQVRQERAEKKERQEKRNRHGSEAARRGGMPKILLGARKIRAQATTGKIDSSTLEFAQDKVREAHEAFANLKVDPVMYADLVHREVPAQKLIAEAHGFNIRFRDWLYVRDLDFVWRGPIRIALRGHNGSGKSTLMKALQGIPFETKGLLRAGGISILSLDQRCSVLDDSKSVFENVRDVAHGTESDIRNGLAKFLFTKERVFQKVETLSGGERLRAALAKGLLAIDKPELLLLDEPTNNLDLLNIEFLEILVREFKGAVIAVSHDETFLANCGLNEDFALD